MSATEKTPMLEPGSLGLIWADDWFVAPDGQEYRGAYGPVTIVKAEHLLGFKPKNSADWFAQVGLGDKAIMIAGCRIHYASPCQSKPGARAVYDAR